MAGNYPDAPSWRMAIDRDGTQLLLLDSANVITQGTTAQLLALNDESTTGVQFPSGGGQIVVVFPELRDIDAIYAHWERGSYGGSVTSVAVSANTTNGFDGTWTSLGTTGLITNAVVKPTYRQNIASSTVLAVRAIRFIAAPPQGGGYYTWLYDLHLYGEPAPGQNPNRLELWHPTLDEKLPPAYFDWGDAPRSSSADRAFRVKNLSASQTANSIRIAMEIATDSAAPSVVSQHTISYGGGSFIPQVNIGSLAPGALSGPVTLRRVTPSNAVLSLWSFRIFAESTDWV